MSILPRERGGAIVRLLFPALDAATASSPRDASAVRT
jgi:hypothetical protein